MSEQIPTLKLLNDLQIIPHAIQRNFTLLHDLDVQQHAVVKELDEKAQEYLAALAEHGVEGTEDQRLELQSMFAEANTVANEKVRVAEKNYQLIDSCIRELDEQWGQMGADNQPEEAVVTSPQMKRRSQKKSGETRKLKVLTKQPRKKLEAAQKVSKSPKDVPGVHLMPVDPNEPTFCFCGKVSYGEMVACDDPECPIEWFHFPCVGIDEKPAGKWYCKNCAEKLAKK